MTPARLRALIASGGLATLAALGIALAGGGAAPATAGDRSAGDQAAALAAADAPGAAAAGNRHAPGREASVRAAQLSGAVPLPDGQTFAGINWDNGTLSDADIEGLLEFNAACRWWIADADAPTKETHRVVAAIPGWPTMRDGDRHGTAVAMSSSSDPALAANVLEFCRRSVSG